MNGEPPFPIRVDSLKYSKYILPERKIARICTIKCSGGQ